MGKVIRFPSPKPPSFEQSSGEPEIPLFDGNVSEQCMATFRMLTRDIESCERMPENLFLMYGATSSKGTMTWSYLALELAPEELAAAVKRVVKHLKKHPNPQPPGCA